MEISSLEALTTEGCDIHGISNRPSDLSGTGYHDPQLVEEYTDHAVVRLRLSLAVLPKSHAYCKAVETSPL